MNNKDTRELAMLVRVVQFGEDNPLTPPNALATQHYAEVNTAVTTMQAKGGAKEAGTGEFRSGAAERRQVAQDLRRKMREIAETAKVLSRSVYPGIDEQFRMPLQDYQSLRDRAEAFREAAEPIKQAFIDRDSPATFIADLSAAIDAFDDATGRRYAGLGGQIAATADLGATAKAGIMAVRALNAILIKRYRNHPGLMAEWKAASRIRRAAIQAVAPSNPAPGGGAVVPANGGGQS